MDSRPILGNRPPKTARTRTTGNFNTANTPNLHPNGGGGDQVENCPRPIGTRSTGNELGEVCGRQKRPIYKDGPRTSGQRGRTKQLGSWQCGERNGEEFLHRPAASDDRN